MTRKLLALLALGLVALAASAWADETQPAPTASKKSATQPAPAPSKQAVTEAPLTAPPPMTTPPPELQKLAAFLGTWRGEQHMFAIQGSPDSKNPCSVEYRWVMNGMHLEGTHTFVLDGKPMTGRSIWSYDPARHEYQCVWLDGMSPVCLTFQGNLGDDGKLVVRTSTMIQNKPITHVITYAFPTPDSYTMRYETDLTGKFEPMLEETGSRAKAGVNEALEKKAGPALKKKG